MEKKDKEENTPSLPFYTQCYYRGEMRAILSENDINEHITLSAGKIDEKIESFLSNGSGWKLIRIEMIYIDVYAYRRGTGGSYKPISKRLAEY